MTEFSHYSVMLRECIEGLQIDPAGIYVDCTLGGGGHSEAIAKRLTTGRLIGIDQDEAAIRAAGERLAPFDDRVTLVKNNFSNITAILWDLGIEHISGAMIDLGVSSYQLDTPERGFSYQNDAPLDMRMDTDAAKTAADVVNGYDEASLRRILRDYGEEQNAARIAFAIVEARKAHPIQTTFELVEIIKSVTPKKLLAVGHHPAKKAFQAIRIEVNGELDAIAPSIEAAVERLRPGGRAAVITFHSLEDRIVKQTFASLATGCTCPPDFPVCVCGKKPIVALLNRKPILPSEDELSDNPRAHSAKLRCAVKL